MANKQQNAQTDIQDNKTENQNTENQDTQKGVVIDYDAQWVADIDKVLHSDLPIDDKRKEIAKIVTDKISETIQQSTIYNCVVTTSDAFKQANPKSKAWSPAYLPSMCQIKTHEQSTISVNKEQLEKLQADEFVEVIEYAVV